MSILIAVLMLQAAAAVQPIAARDVPLTIPVVTVEVDGRPVVMEPHARYGRDAVRVQYGMPNTTVAVDLKDDTGGAVPMSVPGISYDQPLVVRNTRTGQVRTIEGVVEHRVPTMVVRDGSASAADAYHVVRPVHATGTRLDVRSKASDDEGED